MSLAVSIVIRTRDRDLFLKRCLNFILLQTFKNYEIVIVNHGGVQEQLNDLLKGVLQDKAKYKVIHLDKMGTKSVPANAGFRESLGKYIVLLDDDDYWYDSFLERTVAYLENQDHCFYDAVATQSKIVREEVREGTTHVSRVEDYNPTLKVVSVLRVLMQMPIHFGSFVFKKSALAKVGGFNEAIPYLADWDFLIRFLMHYEVAFIPEPLTYYSIRPENATGADQNAISQKKKQGEIDSFIRNEFYRKSIQDPTYTSTAILLQLIPFFSFPFNLTERIFNETRNISDTLSALRSRFQNFK